MSKWTRLIALLFLALLAVYSGHGDQAVAGTGANDSVWTGNEPQGTANKTTVVDALPADEPYASQAPTAAHAGQSVSSPQVSVTGPNTIEIHVNDLSLVEVLRMLSLQSQRNIIASSQVKGTVTANLYNVTVRQALDAILASGGYGYREKGDFIYVYTARELADIQKASRVMATQVFHLYYTSAANAANLIKPVLSSDAVVSLSAPSGVGIDESGTKDTGGNSPATDDMIVVTDYTENLQRVKMVLKEADHRPQQILIEATILRANLTENNALGIDFTLIGGADFSSLTAAGTTSGAALTGTLVDQAGTGAITRKGYVAAGTGFNQAVPSGGLNIGIVHDNLGIFLQALESVSNAVVLANPKVLALNKQKGEVIVGRQDGYLTTTVTDTAKVQSVEFIDTGTRLVYRPFIESDGHIRMEIHPEDSTGGVNDATQLPFKITSECTCNIDVQDGHTIVIGGLFRDASSTSKTQVPFFGNIPILGALFRQQQDSTERDEIIILITPHIVKDDSAYSDLSPEQLKRIEELRVGVRTGMMLSGRERLAETAYENAVAEMNKPKPDLRLALWHLDCAINLNPTFIEAIEMKEKLSGQVVEMSDNSSIRGFVRQAILADQPGPATAPAQDDSRMPWLPIEHPGGGGGAGASAGGPRGGTASAETGN